LARCFPVKEVGGLFLRLLALDPRACPQQKKAMGARKRFSSKIALCLLLK
jgi:hypothetical protein